MIAFETTFLALQILLSSFPCSTIGSPSAV